MEWKQHPNRYKQESISICGPSKKTTVSFSILISSKYSSAIQGYGTNEWAKINIW